MAHTNLRWKKSDKLADVLYDIRGPVLAEAQRLDCLLYTSRCV